jgi:GrpB-like predicted nucleotidyltransferase (UPF0157 family)
LIIQGLIDVGGLHIGSAAVLGLDPKPIIDLGAVVADQLGAAAATRALVAAGWLHEGDLGVRGAPATIGATPGSRRRLTTTRRG